MMILGLMMTAQAYELAGDDWTWSCEPVPNEWVLDTSSFPSSVGSSSEIEQAFQAALDTWESDGGTDLQLTYGGTTTSGTYADDGVNEVLFLDDYDEDNDNITATTFPWGSSGDTADCDIVVLSTMTEDGAFHDLEWSADTSGPRSDELDLETVFVSLIGRCLGLGFVDSGDGAMRMPQEVGEVKRQLSDDDIDGLQAIYGEEGTLEAIWDVDGDGFWSCDDDCDDDDPLVNPDASEVCDELDDDCDGDVDEGVSSTWYEDFDNDGYGTGSSLESCETEGDYTATVDGDCDDGDEHVSPNATETCNGVDDDCDGQVDEGFDQDGDGWTTCEGDCDDANSDVHPGSTEVCNATDDDCDAVVDEGFDQDGDGWTTCAGDCDDDDQDIHPDAEDLCDGLDNDCDGTVDQDYDADQDGWSRCAGDCADGRAWVNPDAEETCNLVDDDCDGRIDEPWDLDGDGHPRCDNPAFASDCDDDDPATYPGAPELCDGIDNTCDGELDEVEADADADGWRTCDGDCDDLDGSAHPEASETADQIDNDCDGRVDDGTTAYDSDGDGWSADLGDCDDTDPEVHPGAEEADNGLDDDCDGLEDEGTLDQDGDGDGVTPLDGDCDDADASVHPDAEELNDGKDNDCDGEQPPVQGSCAGGAASVFFPLALCGLWRRSRLVFAFGLVPLPLAAAPPDAGDLHGGAVLLRADHDALLEAVAARDDGRWALAESPPPEAATIEALWSTLEQKQAAAQAARRRLVELEQADRAQGSLAPHRDALVLEEAHLATRLELATTARQTALQSLHETWGTADLGRAADAAWRTLLRAEGDAAAELAAARLLGSVWEDVASGFLLDNPAYVRTVSGVRLVEALQELDGLDQDLAEVRAELGRLPPDPDDDDEPRDDPILDATIALELADLTVEDLRAAVDAATSTPPTAVPEELARAAAAQAEAWELLVAEALVGAFELPGASWSELFWRAGTAHLIAGDRDTGWAQLEQAAAVVDQLPLDEVPPAIAVWLALAEAANDGAGRGTLAVGAHPPEVSLRLDGEPLAGPGEVRVPVGVHRLTVSYLGADRAWTRLVEVGPERHVVLDWWGAPTSLPEVADFDLAPPAPPATAAPNQESPWSLGVDAVALQAHGTSAVGPQTSVARRLGAWSIEGSIGGLALHAPIWVAVEQETAWLAELRSSVDHVAHTCWSWGPGAFLHPGVGAGADLRVTRHQPLGPLTVEVSARAGADLAPKAAGAARGLAALTVGVRGG